VETGTPFILHTADGGDTWVEQDHPVTEGSFASLSFINGETGWVCGRESESAVILKTEDGGSSWKRGSGPGLDFGKEATLRAGAVSAISHEKFVHLLFLSNYLGLVLLNGEDAGMTYSILFMTTDGGQTWQKAVAWFKPVLSFYPGPKNPGYEASCPPQTPEEESNTPIIQITIKASTADDWNLSSLTFSTGGSGEAEDVRTAKLRLNDENGQVLGEAAFDDQIAFTVPAPHNLLKAGSEITVMMVYDFEYRDPSCTDELKEFSATIDETKVSASARTYAPGPAPRTSTPTTSPADTAPASTRGAWPREYISIALLWGISRR